MQDAAAIHLVYNIQHSIDSTSSMLEGLPMHNAWEIIDEHTLPWNLFALQDPLHADNVRPGTLKNEDDGYKCIIDVQISSVA